MPGWTWLDESAEGQEDSLIAECDEIATQISALNEAIERESFERQARYEDGGDYLEFEDEAEERQYNAQRKIREQRRDMELDSLHAMLQERGARMMRPYEHWNEDERYMEYMERDRD